jgi:hypothetical protein
MHSLKLMLNLIDSFSDETYFPLNDEVNEKKFNFKLSESLHKARLRKVFQVIFVRLVCLQNKNDLLF